MEKRTTHYNRILTHLRKYGCITSWESIMEYGNTRLSATIYELRQNGYVIDSEYVKATNRFGDKVSFVRYTLKHKF